MRGRAAQGRVVGDGGAVGQRCQLERVCLVLFASIITRVPTHHVRAPGGVIAY